MTNCPNCGAVITGPQCEYCGTVFETAKTVVTHYADGVPYCTTVQERQNISVELFDKGLISANELRELLKYKKESK